jgi:integrase
MPSMPRPRKPYVQKETTRHGTVVWYFRRGKGPRIRLPGVFGSKEFNKAYDLAFAGEKVEAVADLPQGTFGWLSKKYQSSGRFSKLRPNTQRNHRLMLADICKTGKDLKFAKLDASDIKKGIVSREGKPRMAQMFLSVMRAIYNFAQDSGLVERNPTDGIKAPKHKTDGFRTWTEAEVEQYCKRHPVGTQARLALDILLYTGLRRDDAIQLGRQHVRNGFIEIRAGKNRAEIIIPLLPPLAESINATKTGDMVFLVDKHGKPWKNLPFGYWFADRCKEADCKGRAHGLRKAGATFAANNGASDRELMAMYGWASASMAEIYTKKADRARLAEQAANKLYPHVAKSAGKTAKKNSNNN